MKKALLISLSFVLIVKGLTSCNGGGGSQLRTTEAPSDTTKKGKLLNTLSKDFDLASPDIERISPEDEDKLKKADVIVDALISDFNSKSKDQINLRNKTFEISYEDLYQLVNSTPDNGFIFFEFGIKDKVLKTDGGYEYADLNMKISKLDSKYLPLDNLPNEILLNSFDSNSKSNLSDAYKMLSDKGYTHFNISINKAAVIFKKTLSLKWLTENNLVENEDIKLIQVSENNKTTLLIQAMDDNNKTINGNRGSQCCPPQN